MSQKEKPVCTHCGSDDIGKDATTSWDVDKQEWVLEGTYDDYFCHSCEETYKSVNWVPA